MTKQIDFDKLASDIAELNFLKAEVKRLSMIYQVEKKQAAAEFNNVPLDTYYHLEYSKWEVIREAYDAAIERSFTLRFQAADIAKELGHDLPEFTKLNIYSWRSTCRVCGHDAYVNINPAQKELDLSGGALTMQCNHAIHYVNERGI